MAEPTVAHAASPPCHVHLIDANNVRGAMQFPELGTFAWAVGRWARAGPALVVLCVDHGNLH